MTREEAIKIIEFVRNNALDFKLDKALEMAIKALEQEPVLDKIRAEIEQIELLASYTRGDIKQIALDIIDKYKAESGVSE